MKVLMNYRDRKLYPDCPEEIDDKFLNEEWAQRNHSQSLKRLNERGGLSPQEMMCNIEKKSLREIYNYTERQAVDKLKAIKENQNG